MLENLLLGFQSALSVENLIWCFVGVLLGTVIGIMPGLGSATGVAILLPLTLAFDPLTALIMLSGIYHGSQYGSTITAVLIATPGEASAVVSTLDGYQMARKGRAGPALAIAALSAFAGSLVSVILMLALAQTFADIALGFGPIELLAIMVFGFATISVFSSGNLLLGMAMCTLGVLLATVGIDVGTGVARYTFGSVDLFSGIPFVEVMIGLFAVGELLNQLDKGHPKPIRARFRDLLLTKEDIRYAVPSTIRGTIIGFVAGILPGAGSTLASFLAYGSERKLAKRRDRMGTGIVEGLAAPESATSAAANGAFVPTLTLGVPGGATTAVLLGAFVLFGIVPGPLLFEQQPQLVWGLLVSFLVAHMLLLVLNLPMAPVFAQLLRLRYGYLYPLIVFTSLIGAYAISNNSFSLWVVLVAGVVGYLFKRLGFPIAPLVLGLVIGPLFEKALVQTSALGGGDLGIVLTSPVAVGVLIASLLLLVGPKVIALVRGTKGSGLGIDDPEAQLGTLVDDADALPDPDALPGLDADDATASASARRGRHGADDAPSGGDRSG